MVFFRKKELDKKHREVMDRLNSMHFSVQNSFHAVKKDTSNIYEWVNYLYSRNQEHQDHIHQLLTQIKAQPNHSEWLQYFYQKSIKQEDQIRQLIQKIEHIPHSDEDFHRIFDRHESFQQLHAKIDKIYDKVEHHHTPIISKVGESFDLLQEKIDQINTQLAVMAEAKARPDNDPKAALREKLLRKITKNSRDYVRGLIFSLIRKYDKISGLQLREIIVEEQALTSKSSFYRLLQEIEHDDDIEVIQQGKDKYYAYNVFKKPPVPEYEHRTDSSEERMSDRRE